MENYVHRSPRLGDRRSIIVRIGISHVWLDTYLLWFDDQLTPHLRPFKGFSDAELAMAKWGIGGQDFWLQDGKVWSGNRRCYIPDARTGVAVDLPRKFLFLAVGTHNFSEFNVSDTCRSWRQGRDAS